MIVETIIDYHQLSWPFERALTLYGNNNLNFGLARDYVVHLETAGNLCTSRSSHWSRTTFLIRGVLSSCTGSQEPLERTKQYTTANQWLLNKERTMVIPLWTRTPGQNPLEAAFIIQEKGFIVAKTCHADCLQAFCLAPKMGRPRSSTRSSIAIAR